MTITFDIETIPSQQVLSSIMQQEYEKKLNSYLQRNFPNGATNEQSVAAGKLLMGTSPFFGEIICIGLKYDNDSIIQNYTLIGDEKTILQKFWSILSNFNGVFVSFNGLAFDTPFILRRSLYYRIPVTNNSFMDLRKYSRFPHFDVKHIIDYYDTYTSASLRLTSEFLGIPSPKEGDITASQVEEAYKNGKINEIAKYCLRDVEATYAAYNILKYYTFNPAKK